MTKLSIQEQERHCEDCEFLDDDPVPSECQAGYGKVAYFHKICAKFKLR
jgi:hypothetical protein